MELERVAGASPRWASDLLKFEGVSTLAFGVGGASPEVNRC